MEISTSHYTVEVLSRGLIRFSGKDGVLSDRGALHEVIELFPEVRVDQKYRSANHFLGGLYCEDAKVVRTKSGILIRGESRTEEGRGDTQEFRTVLMETDDPRVLRIDVSRMYLRDIESSGDTSICFLAPGGATQRYAVGAVRPTYMGIRSDEQKAWEPLAVEPMVEAPIPQRLKVGFTGHGWGCAMGTSEGFGLIVESLSSTQGQFVGGEIRATRPRPPAEKKFDEIELQWMPGGKRTKGAREHASLLLFPCSSVEEAQALYTSHMERLK